MFTAEVKSKIAEDIAIMVRPDNHPWNYLCECGDAAAITVKEFQNANAIFISHTHIDHFVNFDSVIRHQLGIQRRIVICGPKGLATQVQARIRSYSWNLIQEGAISYEIRELVSENEIAVYEVEPPTWELKKLKTINGNVLFEEKDFQVTGILLDHKIPTLAYKFQEFDTVKIDIKASGFKGGKWVKELKDAFEQEDSEKIIQVEDQEFKANELFQWLHIQKGDVVGIIMDHAANADNHAKIKAHFANARTVFVESFYKDEDKELADANYHSYASMSGKIMKACNIEEPIPVHFSRKYKEEDIAQLIREFNAALANS
ncbi:peptidase [uncultured Kordia sp.]|uniref:peptidase n=1 Tax=uncultured Kordia sp. TaxID=507699 RepID=UPI00262F6BC9|nr:peptidase [uncultured Kordia sp.]